MTSSSTKIGGGSSRLRSRRLQQAAKQASQARRSNNTASKRELLKYEQCTKQAKVERPSLRQLRNGNNNSNSCNRATTMTAAAAAAAAATTTTTSPDESAAVAAKSDSTTPSSAGSTSGGEKKKGADASAAATAPAAADDDATTTTTPPIRSRRRSSSVLVGNVLALVVAPYFAGAVWHVALHPLASVFTGDFTNPRRWYVDESSIDPVHFVRMSRRYDLVATATDDDDGGDDDDDSRDAKSSSLCGSLKDGDGGGGADYYYYYYSRVDCFRHDKSALEIARVVPTSNAIAPVSEAVAIVVPPFSSASSSSPSPSSDGATTGDRRSKQQQQQQQQRRQFQASISQLVRRLASPADSPWLAKTVLVVSPVVADAKNADKEANDGGDASLLRDTVEAFLNLYLGAEEGATGNAPRRRPSGDRLPPSVAGAVLRHLIVVDITFGDKNQTASSTTPSAENELRILPQGNRGLLPNMDMVFLCTTVYARQNQQQQFLNRVATMHPYKVQVDAWFGLAQSKIPAALHKWLRQFLDMAAFEYTLMVPSSSSSPHSPALDRGIDSLTIQGSFAEIESNGGVRNGAQSTLLYQQQAATAEMVSRLEPIVRGLSNLYEKLHHSTSLYLLVNSERFVKHEEYLVPNLLLLVPFVVRAATLVFRDIPRFQLRDVQRVLSMTLVGIFIAFAGLSTLDMLDDSTIGQLFSGRLFACHVVVAVAYLPMVLWASTFSACSTGSSLKSIQSVACLLAVYAHVPIAFGHVALAFPSALFFAPLIAFPSYGATCGESRTQPSLMSTLLRWSVFFATCPFAFVVPRIFPAYTPYVLFCYIPLHLLVSALLLLKD